MLSFTCAKDEDIEIFLRYKARDYLKRKWCSVYLLLNEEKFSSGQLHVEAYFTLSQKSLVAEKISRAKATKYGGLPTAKTLNFVLIGQLGKRIEKIDKMYISSEITSKEILDNAFDVIRIASELIPNKFVMVECSDESKVKKIYTDYKFYFFQKDGTHNQFCKKID